MKLQLLDVSKTTNEHGDWIYYDLNDDDGHIHPVVVALRNGDKIEEFVVESDWKDDHEVCLGVKAVVNGITHRFTMLWLSFEGVRMAIRSELLGANDLANLVEYIIETSDIENEEKLAEEGNDEQ